MAAARPDIAVMAIDAEKRREDIARITIDLIAQEGLAAATFRGIAAEAGWSTAAITNYFVDKQDLLAFAFRALSAEGEMRFAMACEDHPGDPVAALMTMVPWCPVNVRRWKAYLAFWDAAMRDAEVAALIAQSSRNGADLIGSLIDQAGCSAKEQAVMQLSAYVQGLALQMLVSPQIWPKDDVNRALSEAYRATIERGDGREKLPGSL